MWRLLLFFTLVSVCSGAFKAEEKPDEPCKAFRLKRLRTSLNREKYRIGIIDSDNLEDGHEFSLTIENPGTSKVESKHATFEGLEGGVYKFILNNVSKARLAVKRRLPVHRFTFVIVTVEYEKSIDSVDEPKFTQLEIGKTACKVPEPPKLKFECPKLPTVCPQGLVSIVNNGFKLHLRVMQLYYFHLKVCICT